VRERKDDKSEEGKIRRKSHVQRDVFINYCAERCRRRSDLYILADVRLEIINLEGGSAVSLSLVEQLSRHDEQFMRPRD
jgi:predicted transposase YbfD/YdcC